MKIKNIVNKNNLIIKSVEGVYVDNYLNRKLGRVGMPYGGKLNLDNFENEPDKKEDYTFNPKLILKRIKGKISQEKFDFIRSIMESDDFIPGDIYEWKGKIYFNKTTEVSPNNNFVNIGDRTLEYSANNSYYDFFERKYNKTELEDLIFGNSSKGILSKLGDQNRLLEGFLNDVKLDLSWQIDKKYDDISDEEVIEYIKKEGTSGQKLDLQRYSRNLDFIKDLKKWGIDFDKESFKNIDNFNKFILECPRVEFYNIIKKGWFNQYQSMDMHILVRYRFVLKYNKILSGRGWYNTLDGKYNFVKAKRDDILELCKQIEYAVDDVLGEDKDLFINNPNIKFIDYDEKTDWGGASYNRSTKVISITNEYFRSMRNYKRSKTDVTLTREKFLVDGFIHEIGHSIDIGSEITDSKEYIDFTKHLGYDENRKYIIYTNAIKTEGDKFGGQDNYLSIERDNIEVKDKFQKLHEDIVQRMPISSPFDIAQIFISDYSAKAAGEGFAEYFSFYMGNKKFIDKAISEYRKNPDKFLEETNPTEWYKYSIYNRNWENYRYIEDNKYYKEVLKHNIEMFEDISKIVEKVNKKFKKDGN